MTREQPVVITRSYGPMAPLSHNAHDRAKWRAVILSLRRYYRWVDSGRQADPWASGVGQGLRYDKPRVIMGPPPGGYGPGTASPPEQPAELLEVEAALLRLPAHQQAICRWKAVGDGAGKALTNEEIGERLGIGEKATRSEWRRAATHVYWTTAGEA